MTEIKDEAIPLHEKILNSPTMIGLLSFFFMVILNFACLSNPPYWDDIIGLHNQAIWLAKHNFNVFELWESGQNFWDGGSNIYKFGIIPYLYGILYSIFPANIVHSIGHLFNISCLALAFGVIYTILRKFKIDQYLAFLWCVAVMCEPVMAGRTAALGQESPLLCAAVLSIYFLLNEKYWFGLFFIFAAILVKATGGVLAMAFVVWILLDICLAKENWKKYLKNHYLHLITGVFLIAAFLFLSFWDGNKAQNNRILLYELIKNMKYQFPVLLPIQFLAFLIMIFVAIWRFVLILKNKSLFNLSQKDKISLLLFIFVSGFWLSYALYYCSLPRYASFIVFPMYLFIALNTFTQNRRLPSLLVFVLLSAGIANVNGFYYWPLKPIQARSGEYLERSREFVEDLWKNQDACRLLETKYFNHPIVANWPFVQMLTMPEMGYVKKALPNVYCAGTAIKYADTKLYTANIKMPYNTLYIFSANSFSVWSPVSLLPNPGQKYKVILKNQIDGSWFIVYEKEMER